MAEEMWTQLTVGPVAETDTEKVKEAIGEAMEQYEGDFFPRDEIKVVKDDNGVTFTVDVGSPSFGAGDAFEGDGTISELMEIGAPYVLQDAGKLGVRGGIDFSWHPVYGNTARLRDRADNGEVVIEESVLKRLHKHLTAEEFTKAVIGHFAAPGSPESIESWALIDATKGLATPEPKQMPPRQAFTKVEEQVLGAFIHWPLDEHENVFVDDKVWESLQARFTNPPKDTFREDVDELP